MGDVFQDSAVLGQASEAAGRLLKEDPQLLDPLYEGIRKKLEHIISQSSESLRL